MVQINNNPKTDPKVAPRITLMRWVACRAASKSLEEGDSEGVVCDPVPSMPSTELIGEVDEFI